MAKWYSVENDAAVARLTAAWDDAPIENLETLGFILETAQEQVIAYAPDLPATTVVDGYITQEPPAIPNRWVYAQLKQAENLWNAGRVSTGGDVGVDGGYSYTPRPLDKTIRSIIRPADGKPDVY